MRCCMCPNAPASIVGGNMLCEEHLAEAMTQSGTVVEDHRPEPEKPKAHHDVFDPLCEKHIEGRHPVRDSAYCEICRGVNRAQD